MALTPGTMAGPYRVVELVGRGGMATVYRAVQESLQRDIALKVMHEFLADDAEFRERFVREARAVAQLRHPNIVTCHDFGEAADGAMYIASEFIKGPTLAQRTGRPWDLNEALGVLEPLASAIDYAHSRGVIHRDIKPSNVILTTGGEPVLTDFGLSRMKGSLPAVTHTEETLGTIEYMAPEQVDGGEANSEKADIYSLAVIAYELLTGELPFVSETRLGVLFALMQQEPRPPRELNPAIPSAVEEVVLRCLAKQPDDRFESGDAFVKALREAANAPDQAARPPAVEDGPARKVYPMETNVTTPVFDDGSDDNRDENTGLTAAEVEDLKAKSRALVQRLSGATGSRALQLIDEITVDDRKVRRSTAEGMELLRVRVSDMLSSDGSSKQVARDLVDLRRVLSQINPNETSKSGLRRTFEALPFAAGTRNVLERIAIRYEDVSQQGITIEKRLREGQTMLQRDNIEMRKLYEDTEAQQLTVRRDAFLGEMLIEDLNGLLAGSADEQKRAQIQNVLYDVSIRVQDLRTTEEVHNQFFVSIELARENNRRLSQAVERTVFLTTRTLMVGLSIQTALARQKRVLEATEKTRQFLGELITANAAAIKQSTEAIGDIYKNPVVALEMLSRAHADLMEALDLADRVKADGIVGAQENIKQLKGLIEESRKRITGPDEPPKLPGSGVAD